jgi:peptidoglycan/xylan/chitin deacetylase (PgdA/CDA1 family)
MYHRIVPLSEAGDSLSGLVVPPATFDAQLGALEAAGWQSITASALADDLEKGTKPTPKTFVITIDDGWSDGYTYALPILREHGFVATYYVIAGRINWVNFLSADQLRNIVAAGNEVGVHTMDHVGLAGLTDARLLYEVDGAAATIASATGRWPETLAYPFGDFDSRAEAAVQACTGLKMAFIEGDGTYESWPSRFAAPRVHVYPSTTPATLLSWVEHPWLPVFATPTPSTHPSAGPSAHPSTTPSAHPSAGPSAHPSSAPTPHPSAASS